MKLDHQSQKIAVRTQTGVNILNVNHIMYCKGEGRYTFIYLINNKEIVTAKLLKDVEMALPDDIFFRIHKSYLINLDYVKELNILKDKTIILNNDTKLKLSSRRQPEFYEKLMMNVTLV